MKQSILQSNLILVTRAEKGLNLARMRRLLASGDAKSAQKILIEAGYGENVPKESASDFNVLLDHALRNLIKEFEEINPDENITRVFILEFLYHNAKVHYKARFSKLNPAALYNFGQDIKDAIAQKNYESLPAVLAETLSRLDEKTLPTPREIDTEIDKAYFADVMSRLKDGLVKKYFTARIDLVNMGIIHRAKLLSLPYDDMLLPNGSDTEYPEIASFLAKNDMTAFENAREEFLLEIFSVEKDNPFKAGGIIFYYLSKLNEFKTVRMILTMLNSGIDKKTIERRLGGLYGKNS